jgi:hypothetical protein
MKRGQKSLMNIVSDDITISSTKHKKGCFTNERDEALASRFYFYSGLKGLRYDVCLVSLRKEFFLSETVITQRLMEKQDFLKTLKAKDIKPNELAALYPHYNWKV